MLIARLIADNIEKINSSHVTNIDPRLDCVLINGKYAIHWNRLGTLTLFNDTQSAPLCISSDLAFIVDSLHKDILNETD